MRPIRVIVPLVPEQMFTASQSNALKLNGLTESWMFEFVLAQWPTIHDYLATADFAGLNAYLDAELGEAIFSQGENVTEVAPHQNFSASYNLIYEAIMSAFNQLKPFVGRLDLPPEKDTVGVMNYTPFTRQASVVNVHFESPEENWLHHSLLVDRPRRLFDEPDQNL